MNDIVVTGGNMGSVIVLNKDTVEEVDRLISSAENISAITDTASFKQADNLCGRMRSIEKEIKDNRLQLTQPLEKFKKAIIAAADDVVSQIASIRIGLSEKVMIYQREQERIAEEARRVRNEALRKQEMERRKAEEAERVRQSELNKIVDDFPPAELLNPVIAPKIEVPVAAIAPVIKSSSVKQVTRKELRVVNATLIPREFMTPDLVSIRAALIAGMAVAGCELIEVTKSEAK